MIMRTWQRYAQVQGGSTIQAQLAKSFSPRTLTSPLFTRVLDSRRCTPRPNTCPPAADMLSAILLAYRLSVCISVAEASRRACTVGRKCGHECEIVTEDSCMGGSQVHSELESSVLMGVSLVAIWLDEP